MVDYGTTNKSSCYSESHMVVGWWQRNMASERDVNAIISGMQGRILSKTLALLMLGKMTDTFISYSISAIVK